MLGEPRGAVTTGLDSLGVINEAGLGIKGYSDMRGPGDLSRSFANKYGHQEDAVWFG